MSELTLHTRKLKAIALSAGILAGSVFSSSTLAEQNVVSTDSAQAKKQTENIPLKELRLFADVFNQIRLAYVNETTDKELLDNAIRGMLEGLDPHSTYLDQKAFGDLKVNTSGEFGGLGLEVGMDDGFVRVVSPIDDTPAQKAGIEAGDLIISLDGKSVKGLSLNEAVNIMRGKRGSDITLTLIREGQNKPFDITLTRDIIKVTSVRHRELEPGFGYIRIANFQSMSGDEVKKAVKALQKKHPIKGIVLDLRNNPGGVLQAAVEVSDAFLDKSLVVYTKGRIPQSKAQFNARTNDLTNGAPLVVLINQGSASASEIVAGALQDHHRAVIMGTQSFGKGSVQSVLPISDDRAIKLTTALYYTPKGRSIQAEGIKPDIQVDRATITKLETGIGISEANLSGHLSNGNKHKNDSNKKSETKKHKSDLTQKDIDKWLEKDNQLFEALNLLKGIHITRLGQAPNSTTKKIN